MYSSSSTSSTSSSSTSSTSSTAFIEEFPPSPGYISVFLRHWVLGLGVFEKERRGYPHTCFFWLSLLYWGVEGIRGPGFVYMMDDSWLVSRRVLLNEFMV